MWKIHKHNSNDFFVDLIESEEAAINEVDSYWNSKDYDDKISSQVAQSELSIPATNAS